MTKSMLISLLIITIETTTLFGQNRMKFKHKLSQSKIDEGGFELVNFNSKTKQYSDTLEIGGNNKLRSIIKLDSKGNILVDFWQISHGPIEKGKWFWKRTINAVDEYRGNDTIVNSATPYNIDNPFKLSDLRNSIGGATKVLYIPFNGFTFGVATMPFRLRSSQDISSTERINAAVTSPKPDISFTGGWTLGKSIITNRSIINYSATFGAFLGLTGAEIKDGFVKSETFLYKTKQVQINPAMSYGAAVTFARNNLGLVFALGFDNSFGDYSNDWIYQNKPWFGIGLSANLGIF